MIKDKAWKKAAIYIKKNSKDDDFAISLSFYHRGISLELHHNILRLIFQSDQIPHCENLDFSYFLENFTDLIFIFLPSSFGLYQFAGKHAASNADLLKFPFSYPIFRPFSQIHPTVYANFAPSSLLFTNENPLIWPVDSLSFGNNIKTFMSSRNTGVYDSDFFCLLEIS